MEKIDFNISGTKEFIDKIKKEIKENIDNGSSIEESVEKTLPKSFPIEIKESIIIKIKQIK